MDAPQLSRVERAQLRAIGVVLFPAVVAGAAVVLLAAARVAWRMARVNDGK